MFDEQSLSFDFQLVQTDQLDTRLKAVNLVGDLFSLPGSTISEPFQPIFSEFLKRLTDRVVDVRMSVLEHVKSCMLSNPFRAEAPEIICKCICFFFPIYMLVLQVLILVGLTFFSCPV